MPERKNEAGGRTVTQRERIERYEAMLDRAERAVRQMEEARRAFEGVRSDLLELERYYTGAEWRADYEADEAGLLPADLKRGVLSEDGIDSLLERAREIDGGREATVSDKIIRYDAAFLRSFEELAARLEAGDRPALNRFLAERFGHIFRVNQYYWRAIAEGAARDFEEADEAARRELMRPLSHRQYRMIETAFLADDEEDAIPSIWNFLHDNGRIYAKRFMSAAEVGGFSLILEQVHCRLAKA
uniref:Uncharacterized protein n=1 Tax=uncultured bacterium Contig575 TaxID=1393592 RepID=W0FMZ7_9BACT|nr:hypothetical protein [uncultured bacterium Contig575]